MALASTNKSNLSAPYILPKSGTCSQNCWTDMEENTETTLGEFFAVSLA